MKEHITTTRDLLEDEDFRKWVLEEEKGHLNLFWSRWIKENPDKASIFHEARELLIKLNQETVSWDQDRKAKALSNISMQIKKEDKQQMRTGYSKNSIVSKRLFFRAAVITLFVLSATLVLREVFHDKGLENLRPSEEWVTRSNGKGQKSKIHLPDGSSVILNADSELSYDKSGFGLSHRDIQLRGEAFFEVAHDTLRPFRVKSGEMTTTALGTSFNIKAMEGELAQVYLATGKVLVEHQLDNTMPSTVYLEPGQEAFVGSSEVLEKRKATNLKQYAWKEGILYFKKKPLMEAVKELERWYGVEITLNGLPKKPLFISGEFKQETLKNVLETMQYSLDFSFDILQEEVTINFNPQ
ncbi:FecR domain-containing protein [Echinicola sediminis]